MLPSAHRLTDPADFRRATRRGGRAGSSTLVAHVLSGDAQDDSAARMGLAVSKAVGNAVVRNRVKRRLRHAMAADWSRVPTGSLVVLRAKPPAARATYADLAADLDRSLAAATQRSAAGAS
ncbi:ribonuclease P protein component [Nocardioides panacisoli]|uniref:ribonuclease P protein component n=1 Tax=Nocardioides panacisoli TaxID=627624 RepID=UPI001C63057B|nr:ribonuclease P protein component [Nocardioides panacisoli]QYJ03284.1 ribonuclease P protein component [Nocardioides panacisoli]